jgi:hypothetical protein
MDTTASGFILYDDVRHILHSLSSHINLAKAESLLLQIKEDQLKSISYLHQLNKLQRKKESEPKPSSEGVLLRCSYLSFIDMINQLVGYDRGKEIHRRFYNEKVGTRHDSDHSVSLSVSSATSLRYAFSFPHLC